MPERGVDGLLGQSARYAAVVVAGFFLDVAVASLLALWLAAPLGLAAAAGFAAGLSFNYLAHALWTFRGAAAGPSAGGAARFLVSSLLTLAVRLAALSALVAAVPERLAHPTALFVLASGLSFVANFALLKLFVFARATPPPRGR